MDPSHNSSLKRTAARTTRLGQGQIVEVEVEDAEGTGSSTRMKDKELLAVIDPNTVRNSKQASRQWINQRTVQTMIPRLQLQENTKKKRSLTIKGRTARQLLRVAQKPAELTIVVVTTIIGKDTAIAKVIANTTIQTHSSNTKNPIATMAGVNIVTNATKIKVMVTGPTTTKMGGTVPTMVEATTKRIMLQVKGITMTKAPQEAGTVMATKSKDLPGSTRGRTLISLRKQTTSSSQQGSRISSTVAAKATPRTARTTRTGSITSNRAVLNPSNTKIRMSRRCSRSWRKLPKS